jgi:5-(carboxyamino)imidazole ribonucleotide synthase
MIPPGATLGVLGGGQLGRMFTLRARAMGYEVVVLEPDPGSPAGAVATEQIVAPYDDIAALERLAQTAAAVTVEFENVPAATLGWLAQHMETRPRAESVATCQDRVREKTFLRDHGLATAPFASVTDDASLGQAWERIGAPALLKTARLGYDGKGQAIVDRFEDAEQAFERLGGVPVVLERRLSLEAEVSVVLARGADGAIAPFPVGENVHRSGILHTTVVPARIPDRLARTATDTAIAVAERLDYVGVLGVELFVADGGGVFVNELAPRPHNSGHYTMDACATDQFEQQVRILAGLPLGTPRLLSPVAMVNLLGDLWTDGEPRWKEVLALPGVKLHLYGKKVARAGRKMGHLNCLAPSTEAALTLAEEAYRTVHPIH